MHELDVEYDYDDCTYYDKKAESHELYETFNAGM